MRPSPRWQSIGGKGGGQTPRGFYSPESFLRYHVSIAHDCTHPHSLVARQKLHKVPCHSKSKRYRALCLHCTHTARATQWQHNVSTLTTHSTACMHSCLQSCKQSCPSEFSQSLPLHMTYHHLPPTNMSILMPLPAVRHRKGCSCLFPMIQSVAGSKLHPLPSGQLCQARVIHQVRQSAADRQTSRPAPPASHHSTVVRHRKGCTCLFSMIQDATGSKLHPLFSWQLCQARVTEQSSQSVAGRQTSRSAPPASHHLTKHCTSCRQPIQNATSGILPQHVLSLNHPAPQPEAPPATFSASSVQHAICHHMHLACSHHAWPCWLAPTSLATGAVLPSLAVS